MKINKRTFLKSVLLGITGIPLFGLRPAKKITLLGYNWQYDSYNFKFIKGKLGFNTHSFYECKFYPNKKDRSEYIYFPAKIREIGYDGWFYEHSPEIIKNTFNCKSWLKDINGLVYVKDGYEFPVKSYFSTHIGWSEKRCIKVEFEV